MGNGHVNYNNVYMRLKKYAQWKIECIIIDKIISIIGICIEKVWIENTWCE